MRTGKIVEYLGTDVATNFPLILVDAGRDTTLFLHVVGKTEVSQWKRKAETSKHNWCFMQSFRDHS